MGYAYFEHSPSLILSFPIVKMALKPMMSELEKETKILEKYMSLFSMSESSPENYDEELLKMYSKILKLHQ